MNCWIDGWEYGGVDGWMGDRWGREKSMLYECTEIVKRPV